MGKIQEKVGPKSEACVERVFVKLRQEKPVGKGKDWLVGGPGPRHGQRSHHQKDWHVLLWDWSVGERGRKKKSMM